MQSVNELILHLALNLTKDVCRQIRAARYQYCVHCTDYGVLPGKFTLISV